MQQDAVIYHGLGGHYLQSSLRSTTTNNNNNNNQNNIHTKHEKKTNKRRRRPQEYYCHLPLHYISSHCLKVIQNQQEQDNQNLIIRSLKRRKKEKKWVPHRWTPSPRNAGLFPRAPIFFFWQKINPNEMQQNCVSERASERASEVFLLRQNNLFPEI